MCIRLIIRHDERVGGVGPGWVGVTVPGPGLIRRPRKVDSH